MLGFLTMDLSKVKSSYSEVFYSEAWMKGFPMTELLLADYSMTSFSTTGFLIQDLWITGFFNDKLFQWQTFQSHAF